ncbi:hypothetical protein ASD97_07715 [Streptomyces sp. Root63]|uniref:hypothetical protein n=1 Tax=unclassified Streptomyces TaxID=2593676 RepID=UPI0006FCB84A|nr:MULTISPECIES: hypothetical protein [unclassified Streptomyces]KQX37771.1 hypothetical protein ASD29_09515 [Streptomyces sp. Root1295]KRA44099.1 hypothetical protein ASD97_07715 [Streptomyces sp. Root63]
MARVVDKTLLAGVAVVTPPAPRAVGPTTTTATAAAATAVRAVAPGVGTSASTAPLGRATGLGAAAVLALLAGRLGRRFGR